MTITSPSARLTAGSSGLGVLHLVEQHDLTAVNGRAAERT